MAVDPGKQLRLSEMLDFTRQTVDLRNLPKEVLALAPQGEISIRNLCAKLLGLGQKDLVPADAFCALLNIITGVGASEITANKLIAILDMNAGNEAVMSAKGRQDFAQSYLLHPYHDAQSRDIRAGFISACCNFLIFDYLADNVLSNGMLSADVFTLTPAQLLQAKDAIRHHNTPTVDGKVLLTNLGCNTPQLDRDYLADKVEAFADQTTVVGGMKSNKRLQGLLTATPA